MNELGLMFGFDLSLSTVYVRRGDSIVFSFLTVSLFFFFCSYVYKPFFNSLIIKSFNLFT